VTRGSLLPGSSPVGDQEARRSASIHGGRSRPELTHFTVEAVELRSLLERWGESATLALADGRVFVDGRRALEPALSLAVGARIEVYSARETAHEELHVLGRWGGVAAIVKPPGVATEPDHSGIANTVVARAAEFFRLERGQVHACSRLDVGVSGVVLIALDAEARRAVASWREQGKLQRRYVALAIRVPSPESGIWRQPIGKARGSRRAVGGNDARPAETRYAAVASTPRGALLGLEPVTGRTHQLRVHASHAHSPLYGDPTYGGPRTMVRADGSVEALGRVALHAAWLRLPLEGGVRVEAPVPAELERLWTSLGGQASDFDLALADPLA
jgi:23S rRNA pseudouridine1911/1915/1917 synthase